MCLGKGTIFFYRKGKKTRINEENKKLSVSEMMKFLHPFAESAMLSYREKVKRGILAPIYKENEKLSVSETNNCIFTSVCRQIIKKNEEELSGMKKKIEFSCHIGFQKR